MEANYLTIRKFEALLEKLRGLQELQLCCNLLRRLEIKRVPWAALGIHNKDSIDVESAHRQRLGGLSELLALLQSLESVK